MPTLDIRGTADDEGSPSLEDLRLSTVRADPGRLVVLRDQLADWLFRAKLDSDVREAVLLAAYEAMANVVVHAYRGAAGPLDVCAALRGGDLIVTVADHGSWQPISRPGPLHGRGLPLIHRLTAHAVVDRGGLGTTVTMRFACPPG
ncbi:MULTISPECIES: ATP-binding protein [Amycolatopsis]|uniref:Anti-sigma regulatory factor n=1 Tax=Amycolatopsis bullii TaxID=941987 RepID=A0ABQ3KUB5_9PSEU|nr:ATP-binding protein [Amycolatopsis bullii]GHG50761.1 anti-sigma regulatory factor [Amycolatopsis bullii]